MASSINQNAYSGALPNFRNLGIMARILVMVNVVAVAAAIVKSPDAHSAWAQFIEISALVEPLLVLSLLVLALLSDPLRRLPYWLGAAAVSELVGGIFIALGFLTRVGAFFIACTMLTAIIGVHWSGGFFAANRGYEYPLSLLAMAIALLIAGGGQASVDRALSGDPRGRRR